MKLFFTAYLSKFIKSLIYKEKEARSNASHLPHLRYYICNNAVFTHEISSVGRKERP